MKVRVLCGYLTTSAQIVGHLVINVLGLTLGEIAIVLPQPLYCYQSGQNLLFQILPLMRRAR